MNNHLTLGLDAVQNIARGSKLQRLRSNPAKYIYSVFFIKLLYKITKKEKIVSTPLFFNRPMTIALPASTDIYLTGGKSHDSEIRLARFMIQTLKPGDHFLDIGAHYGYFTLLANEIISSGGQIVSFEPSSSSYKLLRANTERISQIRALQMAVSDSEEDITFFEFPNLYSEYNSREIGQFKEEGWYAAARPVRTVVKATTIDSLFERDQFSPTMIKIDVEGGEYQVIQGGRKFLTTHGPIVAMEYLKAERQNTAHKNAMNAMIEMGYRAHIISDAGALEPVDNIDHYLSSKNLESDNVLFTKMR